MKRLNMFVVAYASFETIPFKINTGMSAMCVSEPIQIGGWR